MLNYNDFLINEGFNDVKNFIISQYKNNKRYNLLLNDDDKILKKIISLDPTSKIEKDVVGKYSKWLIRQWLNEDESLIKIIKNKNDEDDYKITSILYTFDKNKNSLSKKNIFDYKTFNELEKEILNTTNINNIDLNDDMLLDIQNGDIKLFFSNDKWIIIIPNNKEMSCKYGNNTKWCTANKEHNAFDSYKNDNLYIFLDKNNNLSPTYQFHFFTKQFMDKNDVAIDIKHFFNNNIDVYDKFFPIVYNKLNNKENLNNNELQYLPEQYLEKYLTYYDNKLIDFLKNINNIDDIDDISQFEIDKYIGFNNFKKTIDKYTITINKFKFKDVLNIFDVTEDEIEYSRFYDDDYSNLYDTIYNQNDNIIEYDLNGNISKDFEIYYIIDNILNDIIKNKIKYLTEKVGLNVKLNTDYDYINVLNILKVVEKIGNKLLDEVIDLKIDSLKTLLNNEVKVFPYYIDYNYGLEFNIDKCTEYILNNIHILNLEQLLKSTEDLFINTFTPDNFFETIYKTDYDNTEIIKIFIEEIDEIIQDIEDYGTNSEFMLNDNVVYAFNILREKNLKIGQSISSYNKKITLDEITMDGKIKITIHQGVKSYKYIKKPDEIDTYLKNYQLHMENKKMLKYLEFINEKNII